MKEWGHARGRMEAEIARKKEHLNVATNFAAARGWTRSCWKSKNHNPRLESQDDFLRLTSSEDEAAEVIDEGSQQADSPTRLLGRSGYLGDKSSTLRNSHGFPGPKIHDLTSERKEYGLRLTTEQMVTQLTAIDEFNVKLPPRKKAKESLPEISAPNVHCTTIISRDHKKGVVNYLKKYHNIGFVDGSSAREGEGGGGASAFSITSQARAMQVRSSKLRIASLRKNFGALIGATEAKEDEVNNPFVGMPSGSQTTSALSLSVYNKPNSLARPKTAKVHIGAWGPTTIDPNRVVAEGEPAAAVEEAPPEEPPSRFPDFKNIEGM